MAFAVIAVFMLPDFPHNTRFGFSKEELQVAQLRMLEDVSDPDLLHEAHSPADETRLERSIRIPQKKSGIPASSWL